MKSLCRASLIAIILAGICFAQRGAGRGGGFRGGGFGGGARVSAGFGGRSFVGGYRSFGRRGWGRPGIFTHGRFGYRPFVRPIWGYPGFAFPYSSFPYGYGSGYPGFYGGFGSYEYRPSPNVTVIYPESPYSSPAPVVVNVDPPSAKAAESDQPALYLIAFKDGSIHAAIAYWVDGDVLHYVTMEKAQKTVSIDEVDRGLSQRLNRERRIPFRLPGSGQYQPD